MASEKRLIDANEFEKHFWQRGHDGEFRTLMDAELAIINAPTVDAVEVVRCMDCKYTKNMLPINNCSGHLMGDCTLRKEDDIVVLVFGDDFCSYGERKDNA